MHEVREASALAQRPPIYRDQYQNSHGKNADDHPFHFLIPLCHVMFNPKVSTHIAAGYYMESLQEAAQKLAAEQTPAPVQNPDDIERAIELLAQKPGGGLIVLPDTFTVVHLDQITSLATQYRLPAIYSFNSFTSGGGLVCYGINSLDQFPRAASYIDRILRGERPGDLPVQTPTKFELVINLKAAKAIGLEVPPTLLNRADTVIE
jgi:putative ABC transport system substrate-binding protein